MKKQLIISTSIDLIRIAPDRIVYIASDGNYSTLVQTDGEIRMISYQLGQVEKMLASQLGSESSAFIRIGKRLWIASALLLLIVTAVSIILCAREEEKPNEPEPALFEPVELPKPILSQWIGSKVDSLDRGYTELRDTIVNDIPMRLFIPHNATMELHVGKMNKADTTVIYAAQAADVRADNGGIVGAFVLKGEPLAWGLSKKGYCASIDGEIYVGVAENSPLFEEATEKGGYFFRQYPLVKDGMIIENEPKGKSIRRGICNRQGEIFMVETLTEESFHDFSQALVDLGVNQAVYLAGSSAYGWAIDKNGIRHEFGVENIYQGRKRRMPKNTSYIIWKRK